MIQKVFNYPVDQQRLLFKRIQLEDAKTLKDYDIYDGSTIDIVLRLRGGMMHPTSGRIDFKKVTSSTNDIQKQEQKKIKNSSKDTTALLYNKAKDDLPLICNTTESLSHVEKLQGNFAQMSEDQQIELLVEALSHMEKLRQSFTQMAKDDQVGGFTLNEESTSVVCGNKNIKKDKKRSLMENKDENTIKTENKTNKKGDLIKNIVK